MYRLSERSLRFGGAANGSDSSSRRRAHARPLLPTALYGAVLLCSAIAYTILQTAVIGAQGPHSNLATAVGSDLKGKLSIAAYVLAIPMAFVNQWISDALYGAVALLWLVPDRRIEARLTRA